MRISAIVAMSDNRAIGLNNQLPWHLPADLQHFKKITLGKSIILGRKTFESIGRALEGRRNIVLTNLTEYIAPGCIMVHSLEAALAAADGDEVFIIGGATLYQQFMSRIARIYLTLVHHHFTGDAFFPDLDVTQWQTIEREDHVPDEKNKYAYSFLVLEKISLIDK